MINNAAIANNCSSPRLFVAGAAASGCSQRRRLRSRGSGSRTPKAFKAPSLNNNEASQLHLDAPPQRKRSRLSNRSENNYHDQTEEEDSLNHLLPKIRVDFACSETIDDDDYDEVFDEDDKENVANADSSSPSSLGCSPPSPGAGLAAGAFCDVDSPVRKALQRDSCWQLPQGVRKLGQGGCGTVVLGNWKRQRVAIKILESAAGNQLNRELNAASLDHANVVKILQVFMAGSEDKNSLVVMEYVGHYNLQGIVQTQPQKLTETFVTRAALQIASGLEHCHERGIVHLDVKPANVLVLKKPDGSNGSGNGSSSKTVFKLADFGCSSSVIADQYLSGMKPATMGTPGYQAPEIFRQNRPTFACDVYSFGITLWQLLAKKPAVYPDLHPHTIIFKVATKRDFNPESCCNTSSLNKDNSNVSSKLQELYRRCWSFQADQRPTMTQVKATLAAAKAATNSKGSSQRLSAATAGQGHLLRSGTKRRNSLRM